MSVDWTALGVAFVIAVVVVGGVVWLGVRPPEEPWEKDPKVWAEVVAAWERALKGDGK